MAFRLPPMHALEAFESAARHQSFVKAAGMNPAHPRTQSFRLSGSPAAAMLCGRQSTREKGLPRSPPRRGAPIFSSCGGGTLLEPEVTSALDGITRRSVIEIAADMGLRVVARRITCSEPYCADEVPLTGTAAEITPGFEVDRRRAGDGRPGPLTRELPRRYFDCMHGRAPACGEWLTPVVDHG